VIHHGEMNCLENADAKGRVYQRCNDLYDALAVPNVQWGDPALQVPHVVVARI